MLQDAAIKIDDVDAAVRAAGDVHGPEALVRRGHERGLLARGLAAHHAALVLGELIAQDQVPAGLAHEDVALHVRSEPVAALDVGRAGPGGPGELALFGEHVRLIATVDPGVHAARVDLLVAHDLGLHPWRTREVRVPDGVDRAVLVITQSVRVRVEEDAAHVIGRDPPLATARVPDALEGLARPLIAVAAVRAVEAVVEGAQEPVHSVLGVPVPREPRVDLLDEDALVGASVAVGVAAEVEVRRQDHERATLRRRDAARQLEPVEEDGALIHHPVPVRVGEHRDLADRVELVRRVDVRHVSRPLHDPHAAHIIEDDLDGVVDERLTRRELDLKARRQLEGRERLFRAQHGRGRDHDVLAHQRGLAHRVITALHRGRCRTQERDHDSKRELSQVAPSASRSASSISARPAASATVASSAVPFAIAPRRCRTSPS